MTNEAKSIIEKVRNLPVSEREVILEAVLASLREEPSAEVDEAWRIVIDERMAAYERGEIEAVDFEDAFNALRWR